MSYTKKMLKKGFTLIELAVVLVVIALIVGGILTGRDLIEAAKVRQQLSQIQKIQAALGAFQAKYIELPGDIANADQYGFLTGGQVHSNGRIDDYHEATYVREIEGEPTLFFYHLIQAGLLEKRTMPGWAGGPCWDSPMGGPLGLTINPNAAMIAATIGKKLYLYLGITFCGNGMNYLGETSDNTRVPNGVITPSQAFNIDNKIDDGIPGTGMVYATELYHPFGTDDLEGGLDATPSQCVIDADSAAYNTTNIQPWCRLLLQIQ